MGLVLEFVCVATKTAMKFEAVDPHFHPGVRVKRLRGALGLAVLKFGTEAQEDRSAQPGEVKPHAN